MNILITGAEGFVGRYLIEKLRKEYNNIKIIATYFGNNFREINDVSYLKLDISNRFEVENTLAKFNSFDQIYHLAGISSVAESWRDVYKVLDVNLKGTINLLTYAAKSNSNKFLFVSSSEIYGKNHNSPVNENTIPNPDNPYAITKISSEYFCKMFSSISGLKVRIMRPVSHIGPYQRDSFSIASFCKQVVMIKKGLRKDNILYVGNIDVKRCIMDVRDVVDAYIIAMKLESKFEVLNVGSEKLYTLREVLEIIRELSNVDFIVKVRKELLRPNDRNMPFVNSLKLELIGWKKKYNLKETIRDILKYYEEII